MERTIKRISLINIIEKPTEKPKFITLKGQDGKPGELGLSGIDGAAGAEGSKGEIGLKGEVGPLGDSGSQGPQGPAGPQGLKGQDGSEGLPGEKGNTGEQGETGDAPDHQWIQTALRFKDPDGKWGKFVDLKGDEGIGLTDNGLPPTNQGKGINPSFIFGRQGESNKNIFIQATTPTFEQTRNTDTYIWIQTQIGVNNDCTFWIEDGT